MNRLVMSSEKENPFDSSYYYTCQITPESFSYFFIIVYLKVCFKKFSMLVTNITVVFNLSFNTSKYQCVLLLVLSPLRFTSGAFSIDSIFAFRIVFPVIVHYKYWKCRFLPSTAILSMGYQFKYACVDFLISIFIRKAI